MAVIVYKKTTFNVPALIEPDIYARLKQAVDTQPLFKIYTPTEYFTAHFKRRLTTLLYAFPVFVVVLGYMLYHGVPAKPLPGWWILLIIIVICTGAVSGFVFVSLLLEGRSYATYLYNKQNYYTAMQYAIQRSSNYQDFRLLFFGPSSTRSIDYNTLANKVVPATKQPTTLNSMLISIFRLLDNLTWFIIVAIIIWGLWKRFIAK